MTSDGIEIAVVSADAPFESGKTAVILLVQDCPVTFVQENSAISVAITEKAIGEKGTGKNKVEPVWDFDCDS